MRGSGDFGANEFPNDFHDFILWMEPNGDVPITALMNRAGKEKTGAPEFTWFGEGKDITRLQVNFATGYSSAATTIEVDGTDPSASDFGHVYGSANHLVPGDVLMVETDEAADFNNELMIVSSVTDSNTVVVQRGQAGTTPDTIADNVGLLKIGSAWGEGSLPANAATRNPIEFTNYTQIFKTTYQLNNTVKASDTFRTGDPQKNDKMRKAFDHAQQLEWTTLFGRKHKDTDSDGEVRRFTAGLREQIPTDTTTIFSTDVTENAFIDAVYKVFDYRSRAGDERVIFCGNGFLMQLNKLAKAQGQVQFNGVVRSYGMRLQEWVLPQGTFFIRRHPALSRDPKFTYSGIILDFSAIRWRHLRNTKFEDDIEKDGRDAIKGQWITEGGLMVLNGGLTCGYLGNLSSISTA